jgi:AcrR family transcriptional regulator
MSNKTANLREALILAGIQEINTNGVASFSIRRVAEACGVSCAAPYRHFENKNDFIAAIIDYVNEIWAAEQEKILTTCGSSLREQTLEISVGYVRFLMENPTYRSVLMLHDENFDNLYHKKRTKFGSLSQTLNAQLQNASGYPAEIWERKLMMVRALIFGMVFLYDAGEFAYNERTLEHLRYTLNREFDIL